MTVKLVTETMQSATRNLYGERSLTYYHAIGMISLANNGLRQCCTQISCADEFELATDRMCEMADTHEYFDSAVCNYILHG
jgi:hypothetical protein